MSKTILRPLVPIFLSIVAALCVKSFIVDAAVVEGRSMLPTLGPGSVAVVLRCAYGFHFPGRRYIVRWAGPRPGDLIAAHNPQSGATVVKRVVTVLPDIGQDEGSLFVMGDNHRESVDSRDFGLLAVESVIGQVIFSKPWADQ